jgi:hypothetical protein
MRSSVTVCSAMGLPKATRCELRRLRIHNQLHLAGRKIQNVKPTARRADVRAALKHFFTMSGHVRPQRTPGIPAAISTKPADFNRHLVEVRGLCDSTCAVRLRHVHELLIDHFGQVRYPRRRSFCHTSRANSPMSSPHSSGALSARKRMTLFRTL